MQIIFTCVLLATAFQNSPDMESAMDAAMDSIANETPAEARQRIQAEAERSIGEVEKAMADQFEVDEDGNLVKINVGASPAANPLIKAIVRIALRDRQIREIHELKDEIHVLRGYIQFSWLAFLVLFMTIMFRTRKV